MVTFILSGFAMIITSSNMMKSEDINEAINGAATYSIGFMMILLLFVLLLYVRCQNLEKRIKALESQKDKI